MREGYFSGYVPANDVVVNPREVTDAGSLCLAAVVSDGAAKKLLYVAVTAGATSVGADVVSGCNVTGVMGRTPNVKVPDAAV